MRKQRKALLLSYFTVLYNIVEGVVSVFLGRVSNSVSLVGFGLDSFIESLSGLIMIWRFSDKYAKISHEKEEKIEEKATKLVGGAFYLLALYVFFESSTKLYFKEPVNPSLFGIIITLISLIVMPLLYFEKQKLSNTLKSRSLLADSKQTLVCMSLSVSVLVGLFLNYAFGFWWADPLSGILISLILVKEGYFTIRDAKLCAAC